MNFNFEEYYKIIFSKQIESCFDKYALQAFEYQYNNNPVYRKYCDLIHIKEDKIKSLTDIPFLPVELFKTHKIISGDIKHELEFHSSGTTGNQASKHFVANAGIYKKSFTFCFKKFFGNPDKYEILALLPSYREKENSSLVYMVNELIKLSANKHGGFYKNNFDELNQKINYLEKNKIKYLLFGVSFALLDFAEKYPQKICYGDFIETGGMKGRRQEITRQELHKILCSAFKINKIYSEYGMTELLSQAYSKESGIFLCPPQMKVFCRDGSDPLMITKSGKGAINIIDLANIHSCCFIATSDIGNIYKNGSFEVDGRFDEADVRGCSMLI